MVDVSGVRQGIADHPQVEVHRAELHVDVEAERAGARLGDRGGIDAQEDRMNGDREQARRPAR